MPCWLCGGRLNAPVHRAGGCPQALATNAWAKLSPKLGRSAEDVRPWSWSWFLVLGFPSAFGGDERPGGALEEEDREAGVGELAPVAFGFLLLEQVLRAVGVPVPLAELGAVVEDARAFEPVEVVVVPGGRILVLRVLLDLEVEADPFRAQAAGLVGLPVLAEDVVADRQAAEGADRHRAPGRGALAAVAPAGAAVAAVLRVRIALL